MKQHLKLLLIIVFLGFLAYFPSFFGSFIWDDEDFVYANQYVITHDFSHFFTEQAIAGRGKTSNYYRPVTESLYALTHAFFGLNPFVFHLLNIIAHISAACVLFYFLYYLFKTIGIGEKQTIPIIFVTTLIFLVHPIQTETVSYISGLSDPLYVFWGFMSLLFFLKVLFEKRNTLVYWFLSFGSFMLSVLSKEIGLSFLGFIILLSAFSFLKHAFKKVAIKKLMYYLIPFFLLTAVYLWIHFQFINTLDMKETWGNSVYANSLLVRIATFIQNLFFYISILLFPKDLFMERDATIAIQTSLVNLYTFFFVSINAALIYLLYLLRKNQYFFVLVFSYVAFYMAFIPVSGIMLINGMFYEHFTYLPLIFFFLFLIILLYLLFTKYESQSLKIIVVILLISYFLTLMIRSYLRQAQWSDPVKFYSQTLTHAPKSIRIRNGLAMAYAERNETTKAIDEYKKAIAIDPTVPNLYHNLGNTYASLGDVKNAEASYLKAIEVSPQFLFSYESLYNLYRQTDQKEKADKLLEEIRKQFPNLKITN